MFLYDEPKVNPCMQHYGTEPFWSETMGLLGLSGEESNNIFTFVKFEHFFMESLRSQFCVPRIASILQGC